MQYAFFQKRYTIGYGAKSPEAGEFSRIFVLKVTLHTVCEVTYNCKLQKID